MALAIEVIYAQNKTDIVEEKGQSWSLVTEDNSMAACFEETIGVFENKASILT
jgi:methionine aminopeptidase